MELLADNTLTAYYSRPIKSQRASGEKEREREKVTSNLILYRPCVFIWSQDHPQHSVLHVKQYGCFHVWVFSKGLCGEGSSSQLRKPPRSQEINWPNRQNPYFHGSALLQHCGPPHRAPYGVALCHLFPWALGDKPSNGPWQGQWVMLQALLLQ